MRGEAWVQRAALSSAAAMALLATTGCGLLLDPSPPDPTGMDAAVPQVDGGRADAAIDAGPPPPPGCGDGIVDPAAGEQCDDGSATCVGCRLTCCPDGVFPCATLTCEGGECEAVPIDDALACTRDGDVEGECRAGRCVRVGCGNDVQDPGEVCDDGNNEDGDGCAADCAAQCDSPADCGEEVVCGPRIECDPEMRGCHVSLDDLVLPADPCLQCVDGEAVAVDADGDGFIAASRPGCDAMIDCDDGDPTAYPFAPEILGDGIDQDCDGVDDLPSSGSNVLCGEDRDGDGFAREVDAATGETCPADRVYVPRGTDGNPILDCYDENPDASPRQTSFFTESRCEGGDCALGFDYDCDGEEEPQWTATSSCGVTVFGCRGDGWVGGVPACGERGTWEECQVRFLLGCRGVQSDRTQACR